MTPEHIDNSIARALKGESYLDPEVLNIHGFATATMRHLFSNLCHLEGISYLEVGTFCGATFVAAFNNNPVTAVGIDNFAQDFSEKNVRGQMTESLKQWIPKSLTSKTITFIEADAFAIPAETIFDKLPRKPFDIFYYDGEHSYASQAKALPAFFDLLADRFIFIVDDFNWPDVNIGTRDGFKALSGRVKIEREWNLTGGTQRSDHPIWWNGVQIMLCSKSP